MVSRNVAPLLSPRPVVTTPTKPRSRRWLPPWAAVLVAMIAWVVGLYGVWVSVLFGAISTLGCATYGDNATYLLLAAGFLSLGPAMSAVLVRRHRWWAALFAVPVLIIIGFCVWDVLIQTLIAGRWNEQTTGPWC